MPQTAPVPLEEVSVASVDLPPWERYAAMFRTRNIFAPVERKAEAAALQPGREFRITGLMLGSHNSAVLENIASKEVLFLSEGERQGCVCALKIDRQGVELEVDGEPVRLQIKEMNL
ncbi:MAG: hypothetical protein HQL18_04340 [Candidatus Omnitrophica bacterium]|nr:hypothetical protein [Candidatus Omnitrophota bacterium]